MSQPTDHMSQSTDQGPDSNDPVQPSVPLSQRITYAAKLKAIQLGTYAVAGISRRLSPSASHPSIPRRYPCRPNLENLIFLPPKYDESQESLPLYIDIHGGGYCIGEPSNDEDFCSAFSEHFNIIVVSINYSKAPQHPYPTAVNDIAAITTSVINDSSLRIDKTKVAIGGFSAGGTLALAASQMPEIRSQVKACTPFYPPTDLSIPVEEKLKTRAWRPEDNGTDMLTNMSRIFDYAYVPAGMRLRDPKISPSYAQKADLPEWIFITGAEFDILCFEARVLACRLGGCEIPNGKEGMPDESGMEEKFAWERDGGRIRWRMARGLKHGFATGGFAKVSEEVERVRREAFRGVWVEVGEWLVKGPFKS